jgi:hypothetical protein
MTRVELLEDAYRRASTVSEKKVVIQDLSGLNLDQEVVDFLLSVLETATGPKAELIRVAALKHFEWCPVESKAQQRRFVKALTHLVESPSSRVERIYALGVCKRWMHAAQVSSLIYGLILHAEDRNIRNMAVGCLAQFKPGNVPQRAISLCKRLLKDPHFAGSARTYLRKWGISE